MQQPSPLHGDQNSPICLISSNSSSAINLASVDLPVPDFRASHMTPSEFINFIDYRTHMLNIKGGSVRNGYTKIIITSIQSPFDIYSKFPEEGRKQWLRRLRIVKTDILNKHG